MTDMLNLLRKLFPGGPPPASTPKGELPPLLRQLSNADIWVISATDSQGIDASSMTSDQLLAEIRREVERDQENQKKGYALFTYTASGKRRLPFFPSNEHAKTFCGEYSKERNRVFPFMVLQTSGAFLGKIDPGSCDLVVMNDRCADERVLTPDEMAIARQTSG